MLYLVQVRELYADVISKYGNFIKNSTRWVYTSLESYRQQQFQVSISSKKILDKQSGYTKTSLILWVTCCHRQTTVWYVANLKTDNDKFMVKI